MAEGECVLQTESRLLVGSPQPGEGSAFSRGTQCDHRVLVNGRGRWRLRGLGDSNRSGVGGGTGAGLGGAGGGCERGVRAAPGSGKGSSPRACRRRAALPTPCLRPSETRASAGHSCERASLCEITEFAVTGSPGVSQRLPEERAGSGTKSQVPSMPARRSLCLECGTAARPAGSFPANSVGTVFGVGWGCALGRCLWGPAGASVDLTGRAPLCHPALPGCHLHRCVLERATSGEACFYLIREQRRPSP